VLDKYTQSIVVYFLLYVFDLYVINSTHISTII